MEIVETSKTHTYERSKKEKEEQVRLDLINNEVRLRLEDPNDIWKELEAFAFKHYKWKITMTKVKKFDFTNVEDIRCSHESPIGKPHCTWNNEENKRNGIRTYWPGWKFWVEGSIAGPNFNYPPFYKDQEPEFTMLTKRGPYRICGCHSGTFNPTTKFSGDFVMFVEDFPKIKKKYEDIEVERRILIKGW